MPLRRRLLAALSGGLLAVTIAATGCSATTRHRVLSVFFDGVPEPPAPVAGDPSEPGVDPGRQAATLVEHGPYAARQCTACHEPGATNALVAPAERLCARCHEVDAGRRYVHGPLAAGGCGSCHDPHSSRYRYLLLSEADGFCSTCHDLTTLVPVPGHEAGALRCTACHDPHASDREFLLRDAGGTG